MSDDKKEQDFGDQTGDPGTDSSEADQAPPSDAADDSGDFADDVGFTDYEYDQDFPTADPSAAGGVPEPSADSYSATGAEAYSDAFSNTGSAPDPGYAAFAGELDDPLADWPAPDTPLEELPEMREAARPPEEPAATDVGVTPADAGPEVAASGDAPDVGGDLVADDAAGDSPSADDPWVRGADAAQDTDIPVANAAAAVEPQTAQDTPAYPHEPVVEATSTPALSDEAAHPAEAPSDPPALDPATPEAAGQTPVDPVPEAGSPPETGFAHEPEPAPAFEPASEPAAEVETTGEPASEGKSEPGIVPESPEQLASDGATDSSDKPAVPSEPAPSESSATRNDSDPDTLHDVLVQKELANLDDDFIDDFLNDLDNVDEDDGFVSSDAIATPTADSEAVTAGTVTAAAAMAGSTAHGSINQASSGSSKPTPPGGANPPPPPGTTDDEERKLPIGMIAVAVIALVLLAVGGVGVVQQRSEMQAEIRDLRAQLATTITPEQAEMERERQRQVERESEALSSELAALDAENEQLKTQLNALEMQLAERQAEADAQAAREAEAIAKAASEAAARERAESAAAAERASAATSGGETGGGSGEWFVNFGSYAQKDVADSWAERIQTSDGRVIVQSASAGGRTLFRVRVVGLRSQDIAERVATTLEREYKLPRLWVGKNS